MRWPISLLAFFSIFWAYCDSDKKSNLILRYNETESIRSLDPVQSFKRAHIWVTRLWAETLLEIDSTGQPVPHLISGYRWSSDGKVLIMGIKQNILFHECPCFYSEDDRKLKPEDVVFSLQRSAQHPASAWLFSNVSDSSEKQKKIYCKADSVIIHFKRPSPTFTKLLANPQCAIVSEKAVKFFGEKFFRNPVGTGPFFFKNWIPEQLLIFSRFEDYRKSFEPTGDGQLIEQIHISFIRDRQAEILNFLVGNLDFLIASDRNLALFFLCSKGQLKSEFQNKIKYSKDLMLNTEYLAFNLESNCIPCKNKTVRRFVYHQIERKRLIQEALENLAIEADASIIPPKIRMNSSYNLKPGKEATFKLILHTTAPYSLQGAIIKEMLRVKNIDLNLQLSDPATHKTSVANGEFDFFRASWIADYPDAENYYSLFYSFFKAPNGPNYSRFQNSYYDFLYEKFTEENDYEKRRQLASEMDSILLEEMPVIPLYYDVQLRFIKHNLHNLTFDVSGNPDLRWVYLK